MARLLKRIALWGAGGLGILVVALAGVAVWYVLAVSPRIDGRSAIPGIAAPVEVIRDRHAVPHIFARSAEDASAALGFVHAQDRLWQMETNRRIAAGRLAEIVGAPGLEVDRFTRTIGIARSAAAIAAALDPETRALMLAYARGVNAFLETRSGPLPPEFLILGAPAPEPWRIEDSIGWTLMMAVDLGGNMNAELMRLRLALAGFDNDRIGDVLPPYPGESWPVLPDLSALYRGLGAPARAAAALVEPMGLGLDGVGSNNWVLSGARTTTGRPILANDPHLGLSTPALWYMARLTDPTGTVIGATLPGAPGVVLGRNDRIAWGFTNTAPDVQDLYIERVDPADPNRYLAPDGWRRFDTVEEVIRVRGGADVRLTVRLSRNGPVISDGASAAASAGVPPGHALSLRWTALDADNTTARATLMMNRARDWPSFLAAARAFVAPQQNMVYADVDGNIGFVAAGRVPVRKPEHDLFGLAPAPGWDARYDWAGFLPFEALPQEFNPARGHRMTANERITPPDYPHHITFEWTAPHRADRIEELLAATPRHSMATTRDIMADVRSNAVREILPLLLRAPVAGERERAVVARLAAFDGTMAVDRAEPLIVTAWLREVARGIMRAPFGPELFDAYFDQRHVFVFNVLAGHARHEGWCVHEGRPDPGCEQLVSAALTRALDDLTRRFGADQNRWRWGEAHAARSEHRPFARVGALSPIFDVRVPHPGDTFTVNVGRPVFRNEAEPFVTRHAASLRAIYDLADLDRSVMIHSTGQSGLPVSLDYRSFAQNWAEVRFVPIATARASIEAGALGRLTLEPR